MNTSKTEQSKRFRQMGLVFITLAFLFSAGAFLFPTQAPANLSEWFFLSKEEKESFYMVSLIFIAAGVYCLKS